MTTDHQRAWDTALIQFWRQTGKTGKLLDVINQWERETGAAFRDHWPSLKRAPPPGYPWMAGVRTFVAAMLPLISDRLWKQPPERDAALIDKLQTSGYTTHKVVTNQTDRDKNRLKRQTDKSHQKMTLNATRYAARNHDTDGNVVGGGRRHGHIRSARPR